jgi:hypothetical protein
VSLSDLSRRTFLLAGTAAATVVWLNSRGTAPATAASVAPTAAGAAAAAERPHRTLLGVL